jgi:hypothetical protein
MRKICRRRGGGSPARPAADGRAGRGRAHAKRHGVDRDGVAGAADPLAGKPHDALHQRHVATDIAALDHEIGERLVRHTATRSPTSR